MSTCSRPFATGMFRVYTSMYWYMYTRYNTYLNLGILKGVVMGNSDSKRDKQHKIDNFRSDYYECIPR